MSRLTRWLLLLALLLPMALAVGAGGKTMDYAWLLFQPDDFVSVAIGDSITAGYGDYDCVQGNAKACSGYTPRLEAKLEAIRGRPHTIYERGTGGETSLYGRSVIDDILEDHPKSEQFLIMYGTNDPNKVPIIPSGAGLSTTHPDYPGTFKDNIGVIIFRVKQAGKQPVLAKAPYAKNSEAWRNFCTDEEILNRDDNCITQYNKAIDELVDERSLSVSPPDFYDYFINNQDQIHDWDLWVEYEEDDLHPRPEGYVAMAEEWCFAFTNSSRCYD